MRQNICLVSGANPGLRDWSGRKPRQYLTNKDTSVSADTFRSEYRKPVCAWYQMYQLPRDRPLVTVQQLPQVVVSGTSTLPLPRKHKNKSRRKTAIGLIWPQ